MTQISISVTADNSGNITVTPTRLCVPDGATEVLLAWFPVGVTQLKGIEFTDPKAPVSDLKGPGPVGEFTAIWHPPDAQEGTIWDYTITLETGDGKIEHLDPEIQNGPPGG